MLLAARASPDAADAAGVTPLLLAAQGGYLELSRVLVGARADVDRAPATAAAALRVAAQGGALEVIIAIRNY